MKKIFIAIIGFFLFITLEVSADTIYTSYKLEEEGVSEYISETDTLMRVERIFYNNYFLQHINEEYYFEGENPEIAPFIDEDNYISLEQYSNKYVEGANGPYSKFLIEESNQARYIKFHNFIGSKKKITKFNIYYNEEPIDFEVIESNVTSEQYLGMSSYYWIDLKEEYLLIGLKIEMEFTSENTNQLSMMVECYQNRTESPVKRFSNAVYSSGEITNNIMNFILWEDFLLLGEAIPYIDNNRIPIIEYLQYFSYYQNKYRYYNLEKVFIDSYTELPLLNHFHETDDFYILYDYYIREQIEINTNIKSMDDKIIASSLMTENNIRIEGFNPLINGEQLITIYLGDEIISNITINVEIPSIREELKEELQETYENDKQELFEPTSSNLNENNNMTITSQLDLPNNDFEINKTITTKVDNSKKVAQAKNQSKEKFNILSGFRLFEAGFTLLLLSIFLKKKN